MKTLQWHSHCFSLSCSFSSELLLANLADISNDLKPSLVCVVFFLLPLVISGDVLKVHVPSHFSEVDFDSPQVLAIRICLVLCCVQTLIVGLCSLSHRFPSFCVQQMSPSSPIQSQTGRVTVYATNEINTHQQVQSVDRIPLGGWKHTSEKPKCNL